MASFAKPLSCFFLLVLIFSSFIHIIQARQSVFFSKVTHYNNNNYVMEAEAEAPTPALQVVVEAPEVVPTPAPTPSYSKRDHDNGLGSTKSPSTKETPTTTTDVEDEILSEELSGQSFDRPTGNYESTNLYNNINQNIGYTGSNYYVKNYHGRGDYYTNNPSRGNEISEQQGMSDTRFLENGKYFHDVKNEINNNNFNGHYELDGRGSTGNNVERYYGNSHNSNEFNTMEEYDKFQETQGYVP